MSRKNFQVVYCFVYYDLVVETGMWKRRIMVSG